MHLTPQVPDLSFLVNTAGIAPPLFLPPQVSTRLETYKDPKETLDEKNIPVGGYIRISTRKDSQKKSIENQKKYILQWAEMNGYNIVRFYIDVKSGEYMYLRNDMMQMYEDVKSGVIKGLICKEISRTSRDVMDILELKRTLVGYGAFFLSIKENYDSRTDDDEFLLIIYAALAQKERKTTSSRVKITQVLKAKEGKTNVPLPAFGYMLSEDKQYLVKNPKTAPIYLEIVNKFLDGWGQLKIAKWLNANNIPTRRKGKWSTNAVKTVLSNPVYLGITIYNATTLIRDPQGKQKRVVRPLEEWIIREDTHEALITLEVFEKIRSLMKMRSEKHKHEWNCDKKYLGSGILRCAVCKGKIYGTRFEKKKNNKNKPKEKEYFYRYRCAGSNGKCDSIKYWHMDMIDQNLMSFISTIFSDKERLFTFIKRNIDLYTKNFDELVKKREELRKKLEKNAHAVRKQQIAYEGDLINDGEYKERIYELRVEKTILQKQIDDLNRSLEKVDLLEEKCLKIYNEVNSALQNLIDLPFEDQVNLINNFSAIYIDKNGEIVDIEFD
ncbi:recombinase family protein [Desulforamulus ruminis]|uniref:Resolvase domain protein n=1 Tax=Desulforamulus ruminis (strain ATCC 23193 / DSM 2154 / NCIMB 8452 / DL) TaxID=696281 RepID=F6DTY9_DESRL|nr:recombinase family protein [Desulforamulus ruminis]AEG59007.1 Resolvase domain protein [Desulforamulus ruminis DSM 2154]